MKMLTKDQVIRLVILPLWFLFIVVLIVTGKLGLFIRASNAPLVVAGAVIMGALIVGTLKAKHPVSGGIQWHLLVFFLAPLVLAAVIRPDMMSSFAAKREGVVTDVKVSDAELLNMLQTQVEKQGEYRELTMKQLLALAEAQPARANGMSVSTEGMVMKGDDKAPGTFTLLRYLMVCCAADARPLGVPVVWEKSADLKQDGWVRVNGKIVIENEHAKIVADEVTPVGAPSNPYLY